MPSLTFNRPDLYPKQFSAIYDPHRYSLIEASTKAGKTIGCIIWIVERALCGQPEQNFWWIAPVSDQALIAFNRMKQYIPRELFAVDMTRKIIKLANGAKIWFKSGDKPNSLYGEDVYAAVIDEASRFKEEAYIAIRSTLTYTKGPIRIIGNVRGSKNWFYRMARKAQRDQLLGITSEMGYHKIVAADAVAAGVLEQQEIDDARGQMPEAWFRELYYAEPSADGGNPFGLQHIEACVKPDLGGGVCSKKPPRAWGWDIARSHDFFAGIALDEDGAVCRFVHHQGMPWGEITNTIVQAHKDGTAGLVDSTGSGDQIVEDAQRRLSGIGPNEFCNLQGYVFTNASKQRLMEGLAHAIQTRTVWYPEGVIKDELEQFEFIISLPSTGSVPIVRYSAPAGYHDDCVCALALARTCFSVVPSPVMVSPELLRRVASMPRRRPNL
jgi:phage FluMu gp28-like protein